MRMDPCCCALAALQAAWQPDSAAFRLPGLRTTHLGMAGWASGNVTLEAQGAALGVVEQCRVYCNIMAWLIDRGVRSALLILAHQHTSQGDDDKSC